MSTRFGRDRYLESCSNFCAENRHIFFVGVPSFLCLSCQPFLRFLVQTNDKG